MAEQEIRKQVGEKFVFGNDFEPKLPTNAALVSGVLLATRLGITDSTTLSALVSAGATSLQLAANVKNGAALVVNPGQATEEILLVKSVSGAGPYVATLASAVQQDHANGESVKYEQGASDLVLATTVATVAGTVLGANVVGGLVYKYRVTFLATITNNQVIRDDVTLIVND